MNMGSSHEYVDKWTRISTSGKGLAEDRHWWWLPCARHFMCKATCLSQQDSSCSSHVCHLVCGLHKLLNV